MADMGDVGSWHRSRWEDYVNAREAVHSDCFDNAAALYGDIFKTWDDVFRRYQDALHGYDQDRVMFDVNKIVTIMAARDSFITGENASVYVHSNTDETIGRQQANLAQRVARAYWQEHDMWSKFLETREYCKWCATAFDRIYFNPGLGKRIKGSPLHEGEVVVSPMSLFQVAWDPLADEWERAQHAYIASVKPIEEIQAKYGDVDWEQALKDSEKSAWVSQHERYIEMQKPELGRTLEKLSTYKGKRRNVLVLEYFEKPCKDYPQGRYMVIIGNRIVRQVPLELNVIPIVPFYDMRKAGTMISQTPVSRMRVLQEAIDRLASNLLERAMIPDILTVPPGYPTDPKKFAGKAFYILETTGFAHNALEPKYYTGSGLRQDYIMLFRLYEEQMENLAGVSSIAARQRPGYQMSGRMGYIVTEANKALLGKISYQFKKSCERVMRIVLQYVNKYYTEERTASYINESDMREVVRYRGTDIGTNWTLDVSLGPNLMDDPITIAMNTLQLMNIPLVMQKLAENPVAYKKAIESVNPEVAGKVFGSEQDTQVAEDENFQIRQGGTPQVEWWHKDDIHLMEHIRQLNSDEIFDWNDTAVEYLKMHAEQHQMKKQADFNKMAYQMAMLNMGGAGGRAGGAQRPQGAPGIAPARTATQSIDRQLETQTKIAFPEAPSPGGGE